MKKNISAQGGLLSAGGGSASGGKKILYFITQSEFGGAQRYVFDLANNLKTECRVAVAMGEQVKDGKLAKILTEKRIKYFILPRLKRNLSPLNDLLTFSEIKKLIKDYQPDIIHLNSSKISILGSIAALIANLKIKNQKSKIIYTVHGWVFNEPLPGWQKFFYSWAEKFTARFKHKIICVSEYDRQIALKHKIAPAEKLVTIHNGVAPVNFSAREEAKKTINNTIFDHNSLARHPGLDPGSKIRRHGQVSGLSWLRQISRSDDGVTAPATLRWRCGREPAMTNNLLIGSIGHLYKTKGYEYFIKAADILINQRHISAAFIILGEGGERKNLVSLIKKYNLENNFFLAGRIDRAAELLSAFDIYVGSSVKEGLPYSILEAMNAGRPVVATAVGGIPEMIENNKTGLLIKPADANDLAEKIITLLNNKALAAEMGRRAQEKIKSEFGLEKMIAATKIIYQ